MYGPLKYRINTINKKHLDIPRCRINPKKMRLRKFPFSLDGALGGSEGTWPMKKAWARVGQVDLFWTNSGEK